MAVVSKTKSQNGEEAIALNLSKEEVRVLHQSLNEVCNGLDFSDSEFQTRMGTNHSEALGLMHILEHAYRSFQTDADAGENDH